MSKMTKDLDDNLVHLRIQERKWLAYLRSFIIIINRVSDRTGSIVSILVLLMMFTIVLEVIMRYVFNNPTIWAHETATMLYGAYFLLGGAYTLRWDGFVNVEVIYERLSPRARAILDLITWMFFYLFCGALLLTSTEFAWNATLNMERSYSTWGQPVWPLKLCIPLASFMILFQGLAKTIRDFFTAITGYDLIYKNSPQ